MPVIRTAYRAYPQEKPQCRSVSLTTETVIGGIPSSTPHDLQEKGFIAYFTPYSYYNVKQFINFFGKLTAPEGSAIEALIC